ncbi:uncharacterized protein UV8b_07965 [Ustilaginoidea virens]|uniref:Zn(2)-C6 fungal-type domain-containing protein n=1 Tax=Ustilaginoidea virens TaxID=1159556 RepID=A0A8E5HY32_USTVR|nr:uncharacterized protein UV8b_07965 [Ustilaginoidea virens]QUC23724.1 hypothetical protein UV8b_07965 [Ustilaginoidea virens]
MKSEREGETEDTSRLTYPSPGPEAMDSGPFYHSSARDGAAEPPDQPDQPHQPDQHMAADLQGQEHDQTHVTAQEPATQQHHLSRPANLEELQLAAQLGQGLAGAADANMNVEDSGERNMMPHPHPHPHPHPESDQHHAPPYVQEAPAPDPMAQHQMPVQAVGPPLPPHYSIGDGIPPRKRSKVSRACDECRRKKIKCDAQSDTGGTPCSSCARSNTTCLFSRVPQKRGPSKGYIKELADRIHSIENKLESEGNLSQDDLDKLFSTDRSRHSNGLEDSTRKRPFSSISTGGDLTTHNGIRQAPWGSDPRSAPTAPTAADASAHEYTSNSSLAPQPSPVRLDDLPTKPASEAADVSVADGDVADIDDQVYQDFLSSVQPVYPILPTDKTTMQSLLSRAPAAVRTAFSLALPCVGQSSSGDAKIASSVLHEWESSGIARTRATDIVHAQTLLMLIIDADWRASSTLPFLLARGVALANTMKLWKMPTVDVESENDSEDQLCVRIWWSLVLMDRWHAAGTGQPPLISDRSAVIPAGLENIIGEVSFYLLRLSKLLNRISFVISTLQAGASAADASMAAILTDYIENYREDLPAHIDAAAYPMIHLAYWHCRLLVALLTPGITPKEMMWPTKELAHLLTVSAEVKSPLINHFVSLATLALGELGRSEATRDEVADTIRGISERPGGDHWDGVRDKLCEQLRPAASLSGVEATASQGLQHLADLATAHDGGAAGDEAQFGCTISISAGYLEAAAHG